MAHNVIHEFSCDRCANMLHQNNGDTPEGWSTIYRAAQTNADLFCNSCTASYAQWCAETQASFARWLAEGAA